MATSGEVKRTFTIQGSDLGYEGGRYKGVSPQAAARKAAKQLFRMVENKKDDAKWHKYEKYASHKKLKFILREASRGSDKNTYYYEAHVVALPEPKVIVRNGVEIKVTKNIVVRTCTEHMGTVGRTPKTA
jgi:hypothetical protein